MQQRSDWIAVIADHELPAVTRKDTHLLNASSDLHRAKLSRADLWCREPHPKHPGPQPGPLSPDSHLLESCLFIFSFFILGEYLTSHCYIKLQYLKRVDLLLWTDAAASSFQMSLWQKCSRKPLTLVPASDLPLFPLHPPVWAGSTSAHGWDLRWHHSCSFQSSFIFVTENLVSLFLSLSLWLLDCFYFPSSQQKCLKTALKTSDFQINGAHISHSLTIWKFVNLHVYMNQQIFSFSLS